MPANTLQFKWEKAHFSSDLDEFAIHLCLQKPAESNTAVVVEVQTFGLTPGNVIMIDSASIVVHEKIFLAFSKGQKETIFNIRKRGNSVLTGEEKIMFEIVSAPDNVWISQSAFLEIRLAQNSL